MSTVGPFRIWAPDAGEPGAGCVHVDTVAAMPHEMTAETARAIAAVLERAAMAADTASVLASTCQWCARTVVSHQGRWTDRDGAQLCASNPARPWGGHQPYGVNSPALTRSTDA